MEYILNKGPWFRGIAGLFITPWFPDFDTNTMVVSKMPVWVRLHNLPLHFWHHKVLIAIGNTLGKCLKIDEHRLTKGIFTFAKICVEVDLSQGLPESKTMNFNNTQDTILGLRKHSIPMSRMSTNRPPSQCLSIGKKHPQSEQAATEEA